MGMYTELNCAFELNKETPQQVIDVLMFMIEGGDQNQLSGNHPLFETHRWSYMLQSDSYYFDGDTHSTIRFDTITEQYTVTIRCNVKNYHREIEHFIDWITPHIDKFPDEFLGYKRYEEADLPTLLFHPNQWRDVLLQTPAKGAAA